MLCGCANLYGISVDDDKVRVAVWSSQSIQVTASLGYHQDILRPHSGDRLTNVMHE